VITFFIVMAWFHFALGVVRTVVRVNDPDADMSPPILAFAFAIAFWALAKLWAL
jgi:hypothetical protein